MRTAGRAARLFCALSLAFAAGTASGFQEKPAAGAVLLRVEGRTELAESIHRPLAPASLAKLALAVVALESGAMRKEALVSPAAARQGGSRIGLRAGERLGGEELLAATLIASANDACLALAEHVAGSARGAVQRMNALAKRLGMAATAFRDPCGFDRPGQKTTAADLARLADAAMRQPRILELAGTREMRIAATGGREYPLRNTNLLLGSYPGAVGLKTGYTSRAGRCLIALARRDGIEVLLVMLAAEDRWDGAERLLEAGFNRALARRAEAG
jgi:D-alanyl-D-alanine carboxypeptidase (penicillin-binding protein 5/6)